MDADFEAASAWISQQSGVSNDNKLQLYALYKIATTSAAVPTTSRPGLWDFTGRAKWDAWKKKGEQLQSENSLEDADTLYVDLVKSLGWKEGSLKQPDDDQSGKGMVSVSTIPTVEQPRGQEHKRGLHDMAADGSLEEIRSLSPLQGIDTKDDYGFTPLHLAADRGHTHVVKLLLEQGADVKSTDSDGFTPLELAQVAERVDVIALLQR